MLRQIETPSRSYQVHERGVSSGDHSFTATEDGKYTYCFNNEHWGANTKEVSFNVHGVVYVPESEAPQDPLEKEGRCTEACLRTLQPVLTRRDSAPNVGARRAGQGRAELHRRPREDPPEYRREHKLEDQVVEHLPALGPDRTGLLPGVVAEEVL
jgi:hypothetical protein